MGRNVTIAAIAIATILGSTNPARSDTSEDPRPLVITAAVLGAADVLFLFGNLGDVQSDRASRERGALGMALGTVTVLAGVGIAAGSDETGFGVVVAGIGLATLGTGVWAFLEADSNKRISVSPDMTNGRTGIEVICRW